MLPTDAAYSSKSQMYTSTRMLRSRIAPVATHLGEKRRGFCLVWFIAVILVVIPVQSLIPDKSELHRNVGRRLYLASGSDEAPLASRKAAFDAAVLNRYACKKYKRFDEIYEDESVASQSDPSVVQQALHCLELARQAPSAFNTQPYKVILVHTKEQKMAVSKFCLGPNAKRVLDSDCTAIFLADREVFRTFPRYRSFLKETSKPNRIQSRKFLLTTQFYITLFSSGYPLPRLLAAPISFCVRTAVSFLHLFTKNFYPLPSFANAETWSTKQVMLVAMTYMLGCSSRGIATSPMEGINASGMRKVLQVPRRYAIPLIVSTGLPYQDDKDSRLLSTATRRYPMEEVIFGDSFGEQLKLSPQS